MKTTFLNVNLENSATNFKQSSLPAQSYKAMINLISRCDHFQISIWLGKIQHDLK